MSISTADESSGVFKCKPWEKIALKLPFLLEADKLITYAKKDMYIRQSQYMTW